MHMPSERGPYPKEQGSYPKEHRVHNSKRTRTVSHINVESITLENRDCIPNNRDRIPNNRDHIPKTIESVTPRE